jgi:hypothetical protein
MSDFPRLTPLIIHIRHSPNPAMPVIKLQENRNVWLGLTWTVVILHLIQNR